MATKRNDRVYEAPKCTRDVHTAVCECGNTANLKKKDMVLGDHMAFSNIFYLIIYAYN